MRKTGGIFKKFAEYMEVQDIASRPFPPSPYPLPGRSVTGTV